MRSSCELKKCEQKLNNVCRSIGQKEGQKIKLEEDTSKKKTEHISLTNLIRKKNNHRNEIKEEVNHIRNQLEKKLDEMNRIKADLLYKTKREYEEMIRRLENEMQLNHRSFSSREETRILHDITSLKHGMKLLDIYDEQKICYDNYKMQLTAKKEEQDKIWNEVTELKKNYHTINDEIKLMTKEISKINGELDTLKTAKLDMKKQIEDLTREQVARQQQLKRESIEKLKINKQFKKDQLLLSMEDSIRDYNKLINYFHKLVHGKEESPDTDAKSPNPKSFVSSSFETGCDGYQSSSESSSLASSTASVQINQINAIADLKNQLSLGLNKSSKDKNTLSVDGSRYKKSIICNELSLHSPTLSTTSSLNTPSLDEPPFFCGSGSYVIKPKIPEISYPSKKNRKSKKNKNAKISHSVEVINLLSKMQIPIQLSSQLEECLKELNIRRYQVTEQMNLYKLNIELEQEQINKKNILDRQKMLSLSANNSHLFSDTNSDISSCLDSNYESDNNSVRSCQSTFFQHNKDSKHEILNILSVKPDKLQPEDIFTKESDNQNSQASSNGPANSDDSDVTINESTLSEKEMRHLSAQIKKSQEDMNNLNSPPPPRPINQKLLTRAKSSPNTQPTSLNQSQTEDNSLDTKTNCHFFRQVSDGYSSSCTPLSASSITEMPSVNPFFVSSSGLVKTSDPVETAFLNSRNVNNNK